MNNKNIRMLISAMSKIKEMKTNYSIGEIKKINIYHCIITPGSFYKDIYTITICLYIGHLCKLHKSREFK